MDWELKPDRPIYLQLMEQIERFILSGVYKPGSRLPSVRDLASEASVNPNTMQKALAELERSGLISTSRTNGRFVTEDEQKIEEIRMEIAKTLIKNFLEKMKQLGFSRTDTIALFEEVPAASFS